MAFSFENQAFYTLCSYFQTLTKLNNFKISALNFKQFYTRDYILVENTVSQTSNFWGGRKKVTICLNLLILAKFVPRSFVSMYHFYFQAEYTCWNKTAYRWLKIWTLRPLWNIVFIPGQIDRLHFPSTSINFVFFVVGSDTIFRKYSPWSVQA